MEEIKGTKEDQPSDENANEPKEEASADTKPSKYKDALLCIPE